MCIFHNWVELYKKGEDEFLGELCGKDIYLNIRHCSKCNKLEMERFLSWNKVPENKRLIIMKKLETGEIYRGRRY